MMPVDPQPSREDVLYTFAVGSNSGRNLEQYLRDYPQYAAELIDLPHELSRDVCEDEMPLSDKDLALIDKAWLQHVAVVPQEIVDPFATLSVTEQRELAQQLNVPHQVILAFREHRVELASVPTLFLERLAVALNSTVEMLKNAFALPSKPNLARSYKANNRPNAHIQANFEQILIEANVPPDKQVLLMTAENQDG
jgi:hypothetical protein